MSYLVLARKYRPQTFDEVYAQDHITQILKNTIEMKRIAHAYLFTGPRGVGKTSLARIYAKSLNCLQEGPRIDPCNQCQNCQEITRGVSADVIEIDGASNTGVDDIRDLQKELMYSATNSQYKIYIIDEVHMLSKYAFNALLKTLEEPPENVIFIFATTEPHKVLPTIISRCQRYDFRRIPITSIMDRLNYICKAEHITAADEALFLIAKKAEGSMRDALSLMDQLLAFGRDSISQKDVLAIFGIVGNDMYAEIMNTIIRKDAAAILNLLHETIDKGNDLQEFINGLLDYIRYLLLLKLKIEKPDISQVDKEIMKAINQDFSENDLLYLMSLLVKTKADIRSSSNPLMIAELAFVKLTRLSEIYSIDDLITRLTDNKIFNSATTEPGAEARSSQQLEINPVRISEEVKYDMLQQAYEEKPQIEELTLEIVRTFQPVLLEKVKKQKPLLASYFRNSEVQTVVNNLIRYQVRSNLALEMLTENRMTISDIISNHFSLRVKVDFSLKEKPGENKISNPTLDDIREQSPNLADFIEATDSTIS
ncbi:MAG: DNA polymerase III subunit gamma/tau [Candidatus Cloacimonetes bacterium]|nr:DNA polymerase III subunit gamma/tau [Candidatus Cloacimonadota bacterium]